MRAGAPFWGTWTKLYKNTVLRIFTSLVVNMTYQPVPGTLLPLHLL